MKPEQLPSRESDPADDALDRLLNQARWPASDADSLERLRRHAVRLRPMRRMWLTAGVVTAAAATVLVVISLSLRMAAEREEGTRTVQLSIVPEDPRNLGHGDPDTSLAIVPWRGPTAYERLLATPPRPVSATRARAAPVAIDPPAAERAAEPGPRGTVHAMLHSDDPLDMDAYLRLVIDPETRNEALDALASLSQPPVGRLLAELNNGRVDRRFAAAAALARVCGPEVVEQLQWMVQTNHNRREALAALMRCHDPLAARYLTVARTDPRIDAQARSVQVQMRQFF